MSFRKWLIAGMLSGAGLPGCAHVEAPPGGPEDRVAPTVAMTTPDTLAIVPEFRDPALFQFSERISETGVQDAVIVSPRTSPVEIRRGRSEIRVSLREGWRPGVIYQITLLPTIRDLFNNSLEAPFKLIFSTGPEIPATSASGLVTERVTGRPASDIRVEAIRSADSLVYVAETDAEGRFEFERIPEGGYSIRAFRDVAPNRILDDYEPRDTTSAVIVADSGVAVGLAILEPDSSAAIIQSIRPEGQTLTVEFDDFLDPATQVLPDQVNVTLEGREFGIARAAIGQLPDSASLPSDANLPAQRLVVELVEGDSLVAADGYILRLTGIRNINGVVGDATDDFEVLERAPDP